VILIVVINNNNNTTNNNNSNNGVVLCSAKIEKEKKHIAKDAGFVKTEVSGAEVCMYVRVSVLDVGSQ